MQLNKALEKRLREKVESEWSRDEETKSYWETKWGLQRLERKLMRGMGSRGRGRESGWTGENMRDEGYQQGLDRKCVSVNILYLGLVDVTLALGDHETQYRSHVPWWMRARLQCQPTQRSLPTGTNHLATAPINTQANATNGIIYNVWLDWWSLNRLVPSCSWDLSTGSCCFCKPPFVHK